MRKFGTSITVFLIAGILLAGCQQHRVENSKVSETSASISQENVARNTEYNATTVVYLSQQDLVKNNSADDEPVVTHGSRNKKMVALTFDADMTPKMLRSFKSGKVKSFYDQRITDTLEKNNVPATFFITGLWAETYPDEVRKFSKNPLYEIGNHSYDHKAFFVPCYGLEGVSDKKMEIEKTQKILNDLVGKMPNLFRFPGGCDKDNEVNFVESYGLKVIGWDVISGDAFLKDGKKIDQQVLQKTTNGSIVVMHLDGGPNSPATAAALPGIIAGLKKKGFEFVKVSDLLRGKIN